MRSGRVPSHIVCLILALVAVPTLGYAELVRFELGGGPARGVPRSFDELRSRVADLGLAVSWTDPLRHDAYFSATGGATWGGITVIYGGDTVTITFAEFGDSAGAERYLAELNAIYGTASYVRARREGSIVVQTYSQQAVGEHALEVLVRIVGRT